MAPILHVRACAILLSLLLLCSCATENSPRPRLPSTVTMNQNAGRGGLIYVSVRLANGQTLPFVLDTGSPWTLFDQSLEPMLGKRLDTGVSWNFGVQHEMGIYSAPRLSVGGVRLLTRTNIATFDFKELSAKAGRPIFGLLGMDCLRHYCLQLDFTTCKIRFLDGRTANKKNWGQPFPLTDLGDGCVLLRESLVGVHGAVSVIDTGCDYDGWLIPELYRQWTNRIPVTGEARFPHAILADQSYLDVRLRALDEELFSTDDAHIKFNGIGLRFLSRHLVTFDFPHQTMYLKPTSP